ncbi:hypothetical protein Clacol_004026 [Clathrus columnatus]|uniref:Glucose-methanol-choline oxidoreductase N-terminal domain-containing protein n=1 Tax=Clathrus columnatus TaxID=1419009 RepID=A0AAV5A822_9AGAM|nr:hypothetical protein Clacol_004026 [Clathrus columnatus]
MIKFHRTTSIIDNPDSLAQRIDNNANDNNVDNINFEYDVVIVGGGTAGCVLASRLSESPKLRILMVETGGRQVLYRGGYSNETQFYSSSSRNILFSRIPILFPKLFGSQSDYALFTEPQAHAGNVKKFWPRGSAINGMMFTEGPPSDYNEWAKTGLNGAEEWSYQALRKQFERYNPDPNYPGVNWAERGRDGPVDVGYFNYRTRVTTKFIESCVNLGIPLNPDVNSPTRGTLGVTKISMLVSYNKTRVTAETAYLTPEVLQRPNLFIATFSTATRIFFDTKDGKKRAIGLNFAYRKGSTNRLYRVKVKTELILAAGTIHSPHLLMLSGVGAQDELEKHGIPVLHDLPGVGRALQDHAIVSITLGLKPGYSLQHLLGVSLKDKIQTGIDFVRWTLFRSGPLTSNTTELAAFVRSDNTRLFGPDNYQIQDETSSLDGPDLEIAMIPIGFINYCLTGMGGKYSYPSMNVFATALRPQSRGVISLKSSNPFDAPSIDPHYLEKHNDVAVLVRGLKLIMKIVRTEPVSSVIERRDDPRFDHDLDKASDEELEDLVRKRVETLFHPSSTCRMAKLEDEGVVDARLKVHGLENVRVVDASVFTRLPAGHITSVVYAVAEKAADMIKQDVA